MDNLTHTLAGLLVAEGLLCLRPRGAPTLPGRSQIVVLAASAVSNNLPDADFVYAGVTPGKLGYLLHHRGHTHTLLVGLGLALVCYGIAAWVLARHRTATPPPFARRVLLAVCLLGPVLHLLLDFTNNYGVHPFWPLHGGWFYGDGVFIVEPWLWMVTLPALAATARTRVGLWLLLALLVGALGLAWSFPLVPWPLALALTSVALGATLLSFRATTAGRLFGAAGVWVAVTLGFFGASSYAARTLRDALALEPGAAPRTTLDLVVTPLPGNPVCYSAIGVEVGDTGYRLSVARISTLPTLVDARDCPAADEGTTAELAAPGASSPRVAWRGRWEGSLEELSALAARCDVAAFLRFARVPFWKRLEHGGYVVGDLRYDRAPAIDFAEMEIPASAGPCPPNVPGWDMPRGDLLERARPR